MSADEKLPIRQLIIVNIVKVGIVIFGAILALFSIYVIQSRAHSTVKVEPLLDEKGQPSYRIYSYDDVIIADNCGGKAPLKVSPSDTHADLVVAPFKDEIKADLISGIGIAETNINVPSKLLSDLHIEEIAILHKEKSAEKLNNKENVDVADNNNSTSTSVVDADPQKILAKYFSDLYPIREIAIPNFEIPPGYFNISTLRWQRRWESGTVIIVSPLLYETERFDYSIEVAHRLMGVKIEQLKCNQDLGEALWESLIQHSWAGDRKTALDLANQILAMDPTNQKVQDAQRLLVDTSTETNTKIGELKEGTDLAIREKPCYPGEGVVDNNYKGALRSNELVTVFGGAVLDECGSDIEWFYIKTLEGREGYVSAAFILLPYNAK